MMINTADLSAPARAVVEQIVQRELVGKQKYGVTLDRDDLTLTDWLQHGAEEAMDFALYLQKAKSLVEEKTDGA